MLYVGVKHICNSSFIINNNQIRGIKMSKDKGSNQAQQKAPTEPNKAVEAPKVTFVLDHAMPKVEKGSQQINESKK